MPTTTLLLQASDIRDSAHWYWRLQDANGAFLADHTVALDPADWRYEALLDLYGYLERRVAPDKRQAEETLLLAKLGAWIGEQVLGPIAPVLVEQAPVTVRVQILDDTPAAAGLCYLPLELAYTGGRPLAVQEVSLVFEVGQPASVKLQPVGDRLRVLAVFSLPTGASALNLRQERYRLKTLLRSLAARGSAIDLRVLQYGVTRAALGALLEEGDGWDVVHFSGHGLAARLVLEQPDGRPDTVSSAELVKLLRPGRGRLKWVTLSACSSAAATVAETLRWLGLEPTRRAEETGGVEATATAEPLPALAQTLVENLHCAVLAMRYPVGDAFAIDLGERLYRGVLERGQPLSRALQLALPEALASADCPPLAVTTPALFGSAAADLSLRVPRQAETNFKPPATGLAEFPEEPPLFIGRVGVLAQASQALAPESGQSGVLFYGMAGAGKTSCALELSYHYEGLQRFQGYVWYQAPELGKDISQALLNFALAMERQLPKFEMVQVVEDAQKLDAFLPWLTELLERNGILLVLDNLESLLRPEGQWRDERWGKLIAALLNHRGFSRVILTSRIRPVIAGLDPNALLQLPIHALSLDEAALLIRQLPNLGRLLRGEGITDNRQRDHQRQVVLEALRLVQGHPKLLDLADRQAVDLATLERQLSRAGQAWSAGRGTLDAFFQQGESALADTDFLRVLADWTDGIAATLPAAAQDLFHFLCCLEENDQRSWIVEDNWGDLWHRLERAGDPPALAAPLAMLTTAGLVAVDPTVLAQFYRLHTGVAEAGRRQAGEIFQTAVDTELAAYWRAVYVQAKQQEMQGAGGLLVYACRAAAPYLLRQQWWEEAARLLEQVLYRDDSPATVAAVLPWLEQIAAATAGTEFGSRVAGLLARTLHKAGRWREAESRLRALLDQAVQQQALRLASVIAGNLINLLQATGRFPEALALVEQQQDYTRRAGLGPWTQLLNEGWRLQLLVRLGRYEEALAAVERWRPTLQTLPETGDRTEAAVPWNVRELILNTGFFAARNLERWEPALALNAEILHNQTARHAPVLEQARTRFNDYYPLLRLQRYAEAREVLEDCRATFAAENDMVMLGKVFGALADLEDTLNHRNRAIALEHTALRYGYLAGDPEDCAISHFNLANYLMRAGDPPAAALAHRLAAVMMWFQAASGLLESGLQALANDLADFPANPPLPADFATLCEIVEQVEGVRFRDLFKRLPKDQAADGDAALQQVLALARQVRTVE